MERVFKGLQPIPPPTDKEKKKSSTYRSKLYCTTCGNVATQMAIFATDGATQLERYCQACLDANKHLTTSEYIQNFDSMFVHAEPRS